MTSQPGDPGVVTRIYLKQNVLDAARERISWLFDEFEGVSVNVSGGKDSTVVLFLTLEEAARRGRLPVKVLFIDQEAEWRFTIDYVRSVMDRPDVEPHWLQIPFRIFNATSPLHPWLNCWEPGAKWMRPQEHDAVTENVFGTDRFAEIFDAWQAHTFPKGPSALIAGVRAEESPARALGLTTYEVHKGRTWGRINDRERAQFTMYPIYDWRLRDVWKAIHEHGWPYCELYDRFYQYGVAPAMMRLSNLHHETAVRVLFLLQEIEPETWDALTARLSGVNTAGHLNWSGFKIGDLPPMFKTWVEYRDHLLENLVIDVKIREGMRRRFAQEDALYAHDPVWFEKLVKVEISSILVNDYHGTKLTVFHAAALGHSINRGARSGRGRNPAAVNH